MILKKIFIDRKKKIRFSGCWCILFIYTFVKKGATFVAVLSTETIKTGRVEWYYKLRNGEESMAKHSVVLFKPYPMAIGQKIHIAGGPRQGDWEVIGVSERKVKLRCPVSFREFEWDRFCYFVEQLDDREWPQHD
jgi:hypothetical protein